MRTLSPGVFTEGPTDVDFLSPVVLRLATELIQSRGHRPAQVAGPVSFPGRPATKTFRDTIDLHARSLDLVVVHTDGGGNPSRAVRERIEPWSASVDDILDGRLRVFVPAIPNRATEAWMLADLEALQDVLGTTKNRRELGLPAHAREVEQITAPKAMLGSVHESAVGSRQARRVGLRPLYLALGQEVSLENLRHVPSFHRFATEFEAALRRLGFLPGRP